MLMGRSRRLERSMPTCEDKRISCIGVWDYRDTLYEMEDIKKLHSGGFSYWLLDEGRVGLNSLLDGDAV